MLHDSIMEAHGEDFDAALGDFTIEVFYNENYDRRGESERWFHHDIEGDE